MKKGPNKYFPIRVFFRGRSQKLRDYWRGLMGSTQESMTRGAANINKIISRARNDNWRRGREKKK